MRCGVGVVHGELAATAGEARGAHVAHPKGSGGVSRGPETGAGQHTVVENHYQHFKLLWKMTKIMNYLVPFIDSITSVEDHGHEHVESLLKMTIMSVDLFCRHVPCRISTRFVADFLSHWGRFFFFFGYIYVELIR